MPPLPFRLVAVLLAALVASAPASAQHASERAERGARAKAEGRLIRALTAQALDDDATAVRLLDEILAERPDEPTVLLLRAELAGAPSDAVYFARQSADAAPDRADVWLGLARALREAGQPAQAADALGTAHHLAPDDLDVLLATAALAAEQNDAGREQDALAQLVRIGDTVAARLRLSALAQAAGDPDQALVQARAAARLAPSEPAVRRRLAELTREATPTAPPPAASGAGSGSAADADALLAELDRDPRQIETWALALQALARTADPRAGATADDAMLLFSSVPAVVVGAAEAYAAAGRTGDAQETARRGLDALDRLGDAVPNADALRQRLGALLSR